MIAWSCVCRYMDDMLVGCLALDKRRRVLKDLAAACGGVGDAPASMRRCRRCTGDRAVVKGGRGLGPWSLHEDVGDPLLARRLQAHVPV